MEDPCTNCAGAAGSMCHSCEYGGNNEPLESDPTDWKIIVLMMISFTAGFIPSAWLWWKLKVWGIINIFYVFNTHTFYGGTEPELSFGMLMFFLLLFVLGLSVVPILIFLAGLFVIKKI